MPPYLPLISLNRSQSVRIGRGPGQGVPSSFNMATSQTPTNPQSGALFNVFYADLGVGSVRRDVQRHSTLGAIEVVSSGSLTVYSDLFVVSGLAVTAGTGFALSVAAGEIQSRFYGSQLAVGSATVTPAAPPAFGGRTDYVVVNPAGVVSVIQGVSDTVAPTYEVQSIVNTGGTTGTWTYQFSYNGFLFTTGAIAYNAAGSAIATAMRAATGGPNNSTFLQYIGGVTGSLAGAGTSLPTGPATITASAQVEGPIVPVYVNNGTDGALAITRTTKGVGANSTWPSGNYLVLATVYVPSTATSAANYTISSTGVVLTS